MKDNTASHCRIFCWESLYHKRVVRLQSESDDKFLPKGTSRTLRFFAPLRLNSLFFNRKDAKDAKNLFLEIPLPITAAPARYDNFLSRHEEGDNNTRKGKDEQNNGACYPNAVGVFDRLVVFLKVVTEHRLFKCSEIEVQLHRHHAVNPLIGHPKDLTFVHGDRGGILRQQSLEGTVGELCPLEHRMPGMRLPFV